MADTLYFSRDTKVYLEMTAAQGGAGTIWEIPVLDGYSFSQATNTSEITLSEATLKKTNTIGKSRRSRQMFTDSYSPAEWSFQTYARPFIGASSGSNIWEGSGRDAHHHAVEEALWANFASNPTFVPSSGTDEAVWKAVDPNTAATSAVAGSPIVNSTKSMLVNFKASETAALGTFNLHFELGDENESSTKANYKIADCVVNEVSMDFDIDGIATLTWTGFGKIITESSTVTASITEAVDSDSNMIRNRLTQLDIVGAKTYDITLTGGTISMSNNITFLTPEVLGQVNQPMGHVVGTRSVSGNFTAYLNNNSDDDSTANLFETVIEDTSTVTNVHNLRFNIGGKPAGTFNVNGTFYTGSTGAGFPSLIVSMPRCHLEVPTHSIEDVISIEANFHALPSDIDPGNSTANYEAVVMYSS